MAHLRLTPEEYRAVHSLCHAIHLRDECFPIFRYFLAEALHERWPALAGRVALLTERQLRLLFKHLQAHQAGGSEGTRQEKGRGRCELSPEEFRAVARAAAYFVLCGGKPAGFREFLFHYFRREAPALADRLSRLSDRQLAVLHRRAKRPTRWRAGPPR